MNPEYENSKPKSQCSDPKESQRVKPRIVDGKKIVQQEEKATKEAIEIEKALNIDILGIREQYPLADGELLSKVIDI